MNITIPVSAIQTARKLLTRIHFERLKLPMLNHVLATIDAAGLTLAVTAFEHCMEIRIGNLPKLKKSEYIKVYLSRNSGFLINTSI